jgi:hypothetical protein
MYRKWELWFDLFDVMIDVRYGNFLHLPFSGGVAEQPVKTMAILSYIQSLFRKKIADEQKKAVPKVHPPRHTPHRRR